MRDEFFLPIAVLLSVIGFLGAYALEDAQCAAQSVSFKSYSYSLLGGCMVETEKGKFLPLKNYRETD